MLKKYLMKAIEASRSDKEIINIKIGMMFKFLYPYLKLYKSKIIVAGFLMLLLSLISLPTPYLTKYLIDDVYPLKQYSLLNIIICIMILLVFVRMIVSFIMDYILTIISQKVVNKMRSDLFNRIIKLPMSLINKTQTGYLVSRINEVQQIKTLFSSPILHLVISIFELCFSLLILIMLSWKLTLVALVTLPAFYFVTRWFTTGLKKTSKDLMEKSALLSKDYQDSLSGIETIKAFTTEQAQSKKIDSMQNAVMHSSMVQSVFMKISSEAVGLVATISSMLILWVSGIMIMQGDFSIGMYFAFSGYLGKVYAPTSSLAALNLSFQPAVMALSRVKEYFDAMGEDEDPKRIVPFANFVNNLTFKNVYFGYDKDKTVIHDINCSIIEGEKTAFVGPSGSGKSTIIKMILGYYKPDEGSIEVDANNINNIILKDLRDKVGIVNQNVFLFNDTFRNNIIISRPDASNEELFYATKSAGIHEFITQLPQGYDSLISERGNNLSGGQVQRIAIARLILRNPEILIFDEATSQLDGESEKIINEALDRIFVKKTRIVISHRLSNVKTCDKIYVLKNGQIVQAGDHNTLINEDGTYKDLYLSN